MTRDVTLPITARIVCWGVAGGSRNRPGRGRGVAACLLTLALFSATWYGTDSDREPADHRVARHPPGPTVTRHPTSAAMGQHGMIAIAATTPMEGGIRREPRNGRVSTAPDRVSTMTRGPERDPQPPTSRLPQTSGAAATLLLSALAILTLSAAYRVAAATDRRNRYRPRHRA